jgi:hypothetical protein
MGTLQPCSRNVAPYGLPLRENTLTAQQKCTVVAGYGLIEAAGGPRAREDLWYSRRTRTGVRRWALTRAGTIATVGFPLRHPQEIAGKAMRGLAIPRALAAKLAAVTPRCMGHRRKVLAPWRGAGGSSDIRSVRTATDPGSTALAAPAAGSVSTARAEDSGIETASAGLQIANVSGQDSPRASLATISSAVCRQVGYRPTIGRASSLLMICFASLLRPTADISTARLLR